MKKDKNESDEAQLADEQRPGIAMTDVSTVDENKHVQGAFIDDDTKLVLQKVTWQSKKKKKAQNETY